MCYLQHYHNVLYYKCKEETMNNTEKAVKIITSALKHDIEEDYADWYIESWSEMLRAFGIDSEDMKDEVFYILNHSDLNELAFTDDCEIVDSTAKHGFTTYRSLMAKVRKALGKELGWN